MADSSTKKKRVEEYGVRCVKGRWSEWSLDGNGIECETKEQTSGLTTEDLKWLLEPHIASYVPESTQPAGEWVSCEERMPEPVEDETVLMYFATTEVLTGAWDGEDWIHGDTIIPRRHVTHWMPLPAPPQPKGTG